jgi:AcrR family transcriptional regulator
LTQASCSTPRILSQNVVVTASEPGTASSGEPNGGERDPLTVRDRLLRATYTCVTRFGLAKTTVEDVVKESGISRATIYRHFPGGRDELLRATVAWEIARYFGELADFVHGASDLADLLERGLAHARQQVRGHAVLRKMLDTEPERLLPLLSTESAKTLPFIADFLLPYLEREARAGRLRAGVDLHRAADYLARGILSLIGSPGRFDLEDPDQVRELVRGELLGGIVA